MLLLLATLLIYVVLARPRTDEQTHSLPDALSGGRTNSDLYFCQGGSALLTAYEDYADWLTGYALPMERQVFAFGGAALLEVAGLLLPKGGPLSDPTELPTLAVLLRGLLQTLFILAASLKLWLVAGLAALAYTRAAIVPYRGDDPLGQTGSGRLFFSGIRIGLDQGAGPEDQPRHQVVGLARPAAAPPKVLRDSSLLAYLRRYQADSDTTQGLASIILAHAEWPFYMPQTGEDTEVSSGEGAFRGLARGTAFVLRAALEVHRELSGRAASGGAAEYRPPGTRLPLADALLRVLTADMRQEISRAPAQLVATVVLASQAGKVLSYSRHGPIFRRSSLHTHLDARAVLHSLPAFGREYDPEQRSTIRRALVYAARHNAFGPIPPPVDLSLLARSLRQWTELLLSSPEEFPRAAADLQRYALLERSHARWVEHFCALLREAQLGKLQGCVLCDHQVLFVPVGQLLASLRAVVSRDEMQLLQESMTTAPKRHEQAGQAALARHREQPMIPEAATESALAGQELPGWAAEFDLPPEVLHDWSVLRLIPMRFAWLANRVGDKALPRGSLVHLVFEETKAIGTGAPVALRGSPGMVALRAAKVTERLGTGWDAALPKGARPKITETREEYERLIAAAKRPPHEAANLWKEGTKEDDVDGP